MASEFGLGELQAHSLNTIGMARMSMGDFGGLADLDESLRLIAGARISVRDRARLQQPGFALYTAGRVERASELMAASLDNAERFGLERRWPRAAVVQDIFWRGRWSEAERQADEWLEDDSPQHQRAFRQYGQSPNPPCARRRGRGRRRLSLVRSMPSATSGTWSRTITRAASVRVRRLLSQTIGGKKPSRSSRSSLLGVELLRRARQSAPSNWRCCSRSSAFRAQRSSKLTTIARRSRGCRWPRPSLEKSTRMRPNCSPSSGRLRSRRPCASARPSS